jgi:hypothetical protein
VPRGRSTLGRSWRPECEMVDVALLADGARRIDLLACVNIARTL